MTTKQAGYSQTYRQKHARRARKSSEKYYLKQRDKRRREREMRGITLCKCCGRPLIDEESQERGKGDLCESGKCRCKHVEAPKTATEVA